MTFFFVNRLLFLTTCTRNIKYGTAQHCPSTKTFDVFKLLVQVQIVYKRGYFRTVDIIMDGKFNPMRYLLLSVGISLNIVAAHKHISESEQYIQTIEERTRAALKTTPFNIVPK